MMKSIYATLATPDSIEMTKKNLEANGMNVLIANNSKDAIKSALKLIPEGSEVMTSTSQTLEKLRLDTIFNESGKYNSIKSQLMKLNRDANNLEMQRMGAAPEYVIGSVHAITEDGKVIIASNTGSQLPSYSYGSQHVVWVVSNKKITKDLNDGMKRIYEHVLPLESVRVQKAYGMPNSEVKKILIINKELNPNRITIILVNEDLGF